MSTNSTLTYRGDPGVAQSNPRKVALDGPLLNGLKGEEPRNILAKGTQQEGARFSHAAFPGPEHSAHPSQASPVPEDLRHPRENQSNSFLTTFAKGVGTVEFLSTRFTRVLAGYVCVCGGSGTSPIFLGGTLPQGPISQRAPWVQSSLPTLQSLKRWEASLGGPQGWEEALRLGAHTPLLLPPFFI